MINTHLNILHLFSDTPDDKINTIANVRLGKLLKELESNSITDYTIVPGFFDKVNTKEAIQKGHKKIVRLAHQRKTPNVIIAEDDIVFSSPNSYQYFLSQIPEDYDLFFGVVYNGEIDNDNRVLNGISGSHTLYVAHERFYDFILSQPDNVHCDRNLGQFAHQFKYFVCAPPVVVQRGGWSYNLKMQMQYTPYMERKPCYGREGQIFHDGNWIERKLYGQ